MPMPIVGRPGEYTKVGLETEVKIPWLTYVFKSLVFMGIDVGVWVTAWLVWLRANLKTMSFWRWLEREWLEWFSLGWPWFVISLIWCWIGPSAMAYLYRLFVEQIIKQTPPYAPFPSEYGRWRPFQKQAVADSDDGYEQTTEAVETQETVDVNLTTQPEGRKRPQVKVLPDFPNGTRERSFYKAVGDGGAFSEGAAGNHRVSQRQFRKIRDALIARKCAGWRNPQRHKDGVDLSDEGRGLLKALGAR